MAENFENAGSGLQDAPEFEDVSPEDIFRSEVVVIDKPPTPEGLTNLREIILFGQRAREELWANPDTDERPFLIEATPEGNFAAEVIRQHIRSNLIRAVTEVMEQVPETQRPLERTLLGALGRANDLLAAKSPRQLVQQETAAIVKSISAQTKRWLQSDTEPTGNRPETKILTDAELRNMVRIYNDDSSKPAAKKGAIAAILESHYRLLRSIVIREFLNKGLIPRGMEVDDLVAEGLLRVEGRVSSVDPDDTETPVLRRTMGYMRPYLRGVRNELADGIRTPNGARQALFSRTPQTPAEHRLVGDYLQTHDAAEVNDSPLPSALIDQMFDVRLTELEKPRAIERGVDPKLVRAWYAHGPNVLSIEEMLDDEARRRQGEGNFEAPELDDLFDLQQHVYTDPTEVEIAQTVSDPETVAQYRARQADVDAAIDDLDEHKRRILKLRFGLMQGDEGNATLKEVGAASDLSIEGARYIVSKALAFLRNPNSARSLVPHALDYRQWNLGPVDNNWLEATLQQEAQERRKNLEQVWQQQMGVWPDSSPEELARFNFVVDHEWFWKRVAEGSRGFNFPHLVYGNDVPDEAEDETAAELVASINEPELQLELDARRKIRTAIDQMRMEGRQ